MEKLTKKQIIVILVAVLILTNTVTFFLTATGLVTFGNRVVISAENEQDAQNIRKFAMLKTEIDKHYYQEIDDTLLMDSAISGMFSALGDKYSQYYPKETYQKMLDASLGNYAGIGLIVTEDDNKNTIVVGTYDNTPAANVGFQPGDVIVTVNNERTEGVGSEATANKMRGDEGTQVTIGVRRGEETLTYTLTRQKIIIPTVASELLDGQIGYIRISDFTEHTAEDFNTALDTLTTQNMTGLIIDLRDNGGGVMDAALAIADRLLGETMVIYTEDKNGERKEYYSDAERSLELPMVLLVNENTASSSEILAAALQDNGVAQLVGTKTFGKGIIQEVVSLNDGSGYKLTDAAYYTKSGKAIHGVGITPDVTVEAGSTDEDVQLEQARALLGLKT